MFDNLLTVLGAVLPALFESHDSPPNFPVCGGHNRIDISGGSGARRFEQFYDSSADVVVVLGHVCQVGHCSSSIFSPRNERGGGGGWRSLHSTVCVSQISMAIPWAIDADWFISRADVFETSAVICGMSLFRLSVNSVASWLAREIET